jgi:hypothetical protein
MMMPAHTKRWTTGLQGAAAYALVLGISTIAQAQPAKRAILEPIDPGHSDVGPLGTSTRSIPVDMRSPTGFDGVFRVPGSAAGVGTIDVPDERYARVSGGLAAVFPRSSYVDGKKGRYAMVPAGTIYYIGGVTELQHDAAATAESRSTRGGVYSLSASTAASGNVPNGLALGQGEVGMVNLRASGMANQDSDPPALQLRADAAPPPANVLADDQYRRARMRQLLMAAAHAE